jgi:hypothetical protein
VSISNDELWDDDIKLRHRDGNPEELAEAISSAVEGSFIILFWIVMIIVAVLILAS